MLDSIMFSLRSISMEMDLLSQTHESNIWLTLPEHTQHYLMAKLSNLQSTYDKLSDVRVCLEEVLHLDEVHFIQSNSLKEHGII